MGIVLNPLALRIGYSKSWSDSWFLNLNDYVEFFFKLLYIKNFVYFIFYRFFSVRKLNWLFSHIELSVSNNLLFINLYLYEGYNFGIIGKIIYFLKYRLFKKLRMKTFFIKKRLFDKNLIACLFFFYINFFFLKYNIENFVFFKNMIFDKKVMKKVNYLRTKKYNKKIWYAKEELYVMRKILRFFYLGITPYSSWLMYDYFKSNLSFPYIYSSENYKNLKGAKVFLFFFSVFVKFYNDYFKLRSKRLVMNSKVIFFFLKFMLFFNVFLPIFKFFSSFIEYMLASFFNIVSYINVFTLTNYNLDSKFISRYIMLALRNKFNFYDIINPIKKTLSNYLNLKLLFKYSKIKEKKYKVNLHRNIVDKFDIYIHFVLSNKLIFLKKFNLNYELFDLKKKVIKIYIEFLSKYYYEIFQNKNIIKKNFKYIFYGNNVKFKQFYSKKNYFLLNIKDMVLKDMKKRENINKFIDEEKRLKVNERRRFYYQKKKQELERIRLENEKNYKKEFRKKAKKLLRFYSYSYKRKQKRFKLKKELYINILKNFVYKRFEFFFFVDAFVRKHLKRIYFFYIVKFYNVFLNYNYGIYKKFFYKLLCYYYIYCKTFRKYDQNRLLMYRNINKESFLKRNVKKVFKRFYCFKLINNNELDYNNKKFMSKFYFWNFLIRLFNNYLLRYTSLRGIRLYMGVLLYKIILNHNNIKSKTSKHILKIYKLINFVYKLRLIYLKKKKIPAYIYQKKGKKKWIKKYNHKRFKFLYLYLRIFKNLNKFLFCKGRISTFYMNYFFNILLKFFKFKERFHLKQLIFVYSTKLINSLKKKKFLYYKRVFDYNNVITNYYFQTLIMFDSVKFFFNIKGYLFRKNFLNNLEIENKKKLKKKHFNNKLYRFKSFVNEKTFIYGFKFHFVGRFTRKQKSANLWFLGGQMPYSNVNANVDYNSHTLTLRYSACTLKVWLYKGFFCSNFNYKILLNEN